MAKGELLLELSGKTITRTIKEINLFGVRMEANDEGRITGKYNASTMDTVNVFIKTDGSQEWEAKGIQATPEGDFITTWGRGTGR